MKCETRKKDMAYAAVISLKHTIQSLTNPTINSQIIKSAYKELEFVEDVLSRLDGRTINRSVINALDADLRSAVYKLENVLDSYVFYHSLPPSEILGDKGFPQIPTVDEKGVKQKIDSFLTTVKELVEKYNRVLNNSLFEEEGEDEEEDEEEEEDDVLPIADFDGKKSTVEVELWDQFGKVRDDLLEFDHGLKFVSLVGMAGIGKTFLARKIYEDPIIVRRFNLTAWVNVGHNKKRKKVLVDILARIEGGPANLYLEEDANALARRLYQSLHKRRYFIVLNGIWNTRVWEYLKRFFPDNENGSRLLLTTRLETLDALTTYSIHKIRFLSNEESWNLLWQNVFGDESFPPQLEKAGRKIAENCEGLPLLILTIAKILCGLDKTEEYWMKVADRKTTTFTEAYDQISKVLSTSYEYLPQYLKACFLYMGVFPRSCEILLPRLVNLWAVEKFFEPNLSSVNCLKNLVSQSLVIICKHSSNNNIKSSKLHSAYWHLCVKEARKNKFLHVLNNINDGSKDYIEGQRRLSVQNNILFGIKEVYHSMATATLTARSLLCTGEDHQYPVPICFNLMLLKVLDALAIRFYEFPAEVLKLLQLRYLSLTHNGNLPPFISQLQNLQCLIVRQHHNIKLLRDSSRLPKEIWDMQELRHLQITSYDLPDPSNRARLPNLTSLFVNGHSCTEDVFRNIPYLKKLGIKIELQPDSAETLSIFEHIGLLHELESLKCVVVNPIVRSQIVAPPDHLSDLPHSLTKLSLKGLGYSWVCMSAIGSLPNLKVLKLQCSAFQGPEWETEDGVFQSLEFLLLEDIDLVHWTTNDESCFPCLQRLIIRHCYKLRAIPWQIGEIPTLKTIEIVDMSPLRVEFAQEILEEQRYRGNFYLQLLITSSWKIR